ncbi:chitin-inducible gibberellin-responsive protein 1 [Lolium perenne]|uniref:chitin-inducible gibberellin-responsive protein 1 n=2 Tax=Lolium TaxID=4520 RepID=UPI0021EA8BEF|nr:chitin-inducible gibberellin-responsive protein 1 [Lolium perenne]
MDLHQLFKYRLTGANVLYQIPTENNLANSSWPTTPLKLEFSNSPYTPLSTQLECDNLSALSNTPDNQSSSETISAQPISPLEADSSYIKAGSHLRENIQVKPDQLYATSRHNMQQTLRDIETVLMAPDADDATTSTKHDFEETKPTQLMRQRSRTWSHESRQPLTGTVRPQFASGGYPAASYEIRPEKRQRELREDPQLIVKHLLTRCAEALSEDRTEEFQKLVQDARGLVSINGEPIQRLGAYLLEGLVARHGNSGTNIYRALKCREPESTELLSYMKILYNICPYFKFGYMAANGAIAEALRSEDKIHIIDFQIAQGTQWITLIQALAARPGGPPHVRITGIDDPVSEYARGEGLDIVGNMLKSMSKEFKIPLEFTPLPVYATEVTKEMLEIRPGEALAVNFTLQLHHTPDESVDVNNPRDGLLRMVKGLSPKVTTLVEQESHTNTTPFLTRFVETMDYYSAMFESIDANLPRDNKERISVEQHCLAKDIVNIIACEGKDRVERHELLGKWKLRLSMAGFKPYPLSSYVNSVIKKLLACYSDNYTLDEKDGAMLLGWKNRKLISASAWH